jgi:hypothetical protein
VGLDDPLSEAVVEEEVFLAARDRRRAREHGIELVGPPVGL